MCYNQAFVDDFLHDKENVQFHVFGPGMQNMIVS